ncbi:hypothetical protein CPB83DRAFT_279460 [Crepidotus variabilis]|uniref:Glutaminase A central domain-containing protein n=1 Tax=Crepidotus variabilis TaxID=179855 RepID=A0A9P6BCR0_9AGAR|nr:hypothetical protein CPB83DRAFT_316705 [Crepidotus variabilis]KAF9521427.1 hypothetical protein CPB83DRAFT_279460 [Crepidotus variabilis]
MLIMALAHARKSGDGTLCQRHYNLLKTWGDYLSANALNNQSFVTSDMTLPKGDVNLALKAIIGVQAMSAINKFLEPQGALSSDTSLYSRSAQNLMQGWKNQSWLTNHLTATVGDSSSWSLMYNAYADRLLKTSLIGDDVNKGQAAFYATQTSSAYAYGFQYDSRVVRARSDWTMLTAAAMIDTTVRDFMIESVHKRAVWPNTINPWPTLYYANNASTIGGHSSPGHGASFALLAQGLPDQTISLDSSLKITPQGVTKVLPKRSVAGPVAGGVIGGLAFLGLIALGIIWYRRRQAASRKAEEADEMKHDPVAVPYDPYFGFENVSTPTHSTLLASGGPPRNSKSMLTPLRPHAFDQGTNSHSNPLRSEPLSPGGTTSVSGSFSPPSSQATSALRNEVEELRREMAAMRQNQAILVDAPPLYSDDAHI